MKVVHKLFPAIFKTCLACSMLFAYHAADVHAAGMTAEGLADTISDHVDGLGDSVTGPFNSVGYLGELRGKVRSFTLWQETEGYRGNAIDPTYANSSSLGFYINYKTPEYEGLSGALEFVDVITAYEGDHGNRFNDTYYNQNGAYHVFNELYLNYNLEKLGLPGTDIRVGRQIRHYDYFKRFGLRQKDQSMRAIVLTTRDVPDTDLAIGHMDRFSSWSGRNEVPYDPSFINLGNQLRVPYRTSGATFGTGTYTGIDNLSVTLYDWALWDLVNVLGGKASYSVSMPYDLKAVPAVHCAWQRDIGRMKADGRGKVTSYVIEAVVTFKYKDWFSIEPGYTYVGPNKTGAVNDFLQPFDSSFVVDKERGGAYTRPLNAGSQSFTLQNTLKFGKIGIDTRYYYTLHSKSAVDGTTDRGSRDQQVETDIKYRLTRNLSTVVTLVYGMRGADTSQRKDREKKELRVAVTYSF